MKIPAGYTQTEVGVIPEDWEVKKIGELANVVTGNTPPTNDQTNYGDEYFFVSPADLGIGKYILETKKKLSKKGYDISRKFPQNSILFTCIGSTIGKTGITQFELTSNQQINAIFPNDNFSTDYLFYSLNFLSAKIKSLASEQAVPIINKSEFEETYISLPPTKTEQTAIATILSDTDAIISGLEKLIDKKKNIKQGAMQELLTGKKRLPGFTGDWEVKKLGEICNYQNGTSLEKYFNKEDGLKVISIGNYAPDGKFVNTNTFIDRHQKDIVKKYILKKDELTMILNDKTSIGAIIGRVLLITEDDKYVFNQRTMRLSPKLNFDPLFLYYKINSDEIHNKIILLSKPGTQIYVNTNDIIDLRLAVPPTINEQIAIANILSDMDTEIEELEQKLAKYKMVKQGMMQELLTGKTRLI